jgi:hypothetical protein
MIANLAFEVIQDASSVKTKEFISWNVHHNSIWSKLFNHNMTPTRKIILFKLRRLYEEILSIEKFPNFRNAAVLGFCLNVLGITIGTPTSIWRDDYALRRSQLIGHARIISGSSRANPKRPKPHCLA